MCALHLLLSRHAILFRLAGGGVDIDPAEYIKSNCLLQIFEKKNSLIEQSDYCVIFFHLYKRSLTGGAAVVSRNSGVGKM